jgi:hypothetical protein
MNRKLPVFIFCIVAVTRSAAQDITFTTVPASCQTCCNGSFTLYVESPCNGAFWVTPQLSQGSFTWKELKFENVCPGSYTFDISPASEQCQTYSYVYTMTYPTDIQHSDFALMSPVYPSPVCSVFRIAGAEKSFESAVLVDALGNKHVIKAILNAEGIYGYDISELSGGVYLFFTTVKNEPFVCKLVKI